MDQLETLCYWSSAMCKLSNFHELDEIENIYTRGDSNNKNIM